MNVLTSAEAILRKCCIANVNVLLTLLQSPPPNLVQCDAVHGAEIRRGTASGAEMTSQGAASVFLHFSSNNNAQLLVL